MGSDFFFKIKDLIYLFVSLGEGQVWWSSDNFAFSLPCGFWWSTWVIRLGQTWLYMLSHLEASGDLTFYLFLMNNSYLLNFLFCQRDSGPFFSPLLLLQMPFMMFHVGGQWMNKKCLFKEPVGTVMGNSLGNRVFCLFSTGKPALCPLLAFIGDSVFSGVWRGGASRMHSAAHTDRPRVGPLLHLCQSLHPPHVYRNRGKPDSLGETFVISKVF